MVHIAPEYQSSGQSFNALPPMEAAGSSHCLTAAHHASGPRGRSGMPTPGMGAALPAPPWVLQAWAGGMAGNKDARGGPATSTRFDWELGVADKGGMLRLLAGEGVRDEGISREGDGDREEQQDGDTEASVSLSNTAPTLPDRESS